VLPPSSVLSSAGNSPSPGPNVIHSSQGRLRVALPGSLNFRQSQITAALLTSPGVIAAELSPRTGNILIRFDPARTTTSAVLNRLQSLIATPPRPTPPVPRLLHSTRGRLRTRVPSGRVKDAASVERHLLRVPGVESTRFSRRTGTVLVTFDPEVTNQDRILAALDSIPPSSALSTAVSSPPRPRGCKRRLISLHGLDRHPHLGRQVVQTLERRVGVRAWTKRLTGHVLVEYDEEHIHLEDLLAEIAHLHVPKLPGEDRATHPLDQEPLVRGLSRVIGALAGIAFITMRRLTTGPAVARNGIPAIAASITNLVAGFPVVRRPLVKLAGRDNAELVISSLGVLTTMLADFPLGLVLAAVEGFTLLNEVIARRIAWQHYEERLDSGASSEPGSVIRLEAGMRVPHGASVIEGTGTATGLDGLPASVSPGALVPAGAVLSGGPFVLELQGGKPFTSTPRPGRPAPTFYDRYLHFMAPVSLGYAALTFLRTASLHHALESLLHLNPRTAVIGHEAANLATAARCLRAGLTIVGTRPSRIIRLPNVLMLDGPRTLANGLEIAGVLPIPDLRSGNDTTLDAAALLKLASSISHASGTPWGEVFPHQERPSTREGRFNGLWAAATIGNIHYTLGPPEDDIALPEWFDEQHAGGYLLEVHIVEEDDYRSLGFIALRPHLSPGVVELMSTCSRLGVVVEIVPSDFPSVVRAIAHRTGIALASSVQAIEAIHTRQRAGALVAFVSDHADAAETFEASDLAVGLATGRGEFPARADVLAPDLRAISALLEAGDLRRQAIRDGVVLSIGVNALGAVLGFPAPLGIEQATAGVYLSALAALGISTWRLRGGTRAQKTLAHLTDPRPERWARWDVDDVLRAFNATPDGLTTTEAIARRGLQAPTSGHDQLLKALMNQLWAPVTGVLAAGGCLTFALGQPLNTAILGVTISLNVAVGVWQERQVGQAAQALEQLAAATARVVRDGNPVTIPATEVVPGDILVLLPGQRVAADALLLSDSVEVVEAALTGESLPVEKSPQASDSGRIVLEGSDVIVGTARALVVAVGRETRLGATAVALSAAPDEPSQLGIRLGQILNLALPVAAAGGLLTAVTGLVYGTAPPATLLTVGVTTALSAIPEGLPLLAGVGQAGVASRLAARNALVRRVASVEALGRVDVVCTDKTGTLTEGRLVLRLVSDGIHSARYPGPLDPDQLSVLLTAALASPRLDAPDATIHPTDIAILRGAREAGLEQELLRPRLREVPFDSARAFYASLVDGEGNGRLCLKGAPERLMGRCIQRRGRNGSQALDETGRDQLLEEGARLASGGLRVLLVAEGPDHADPDDPEELTALGFVGISDPLRAAAPEAVRRCLAAGIRVIVLTGDHPATARAIAGEAGLLGPGHDGIVRAAELAELGDEELDRRLETIAVIARATPLDKLRIIESLRRNRHTVAMTGDGVNDAPSLRLADVGVAMGRTGTEVARQASDVILLDDDFGTLVEALIEGRGFWRNMRTGLSLLLGGNVGELSVIVGASLLGFGVPLTSAQILIVNMITDALPSLAVVLQQPEHRNLAGLAREGLLALDSGLRRDVLRRGIATAVPTLTSYLLMQSMGGPVQASAVAFASVILTQLAQTLDAGRVEGTLSPSVSGAVGGSVALLLAALGIPPVRTFLGLTSPNLTGWGLAGCSSVAAVLLSRLIEHGWRPGMVLPDWARIPGWDTERVQLPAFTTA
jgi:cation-transporting P-type ATPase I